MNAGDTAWLLASAALVMFMTVGLAFFYGGLEPQRNVLHMLMMNFFSISLVTVSWVSIGFSLAFGPDMGHGFIGDLHYAFLMHMGGVWPGTHVPKLAFMAFQLMFAIITPALVSGAIAGRVKFSSWVAFVLAWSIVVYPLLAHWLFDSSGWLYRLGARDFAGGAVVHASAGTAALIFVLMLGPRIKQSRATYAPHSVPLVLLGAGILWFGWFGFNAGSALGSGQLAANAFVATQLAAASASILWAFMERAVTGRVTVIGIATGGVVGLATITPASGFVGPMPALLIGALAGVVSFSAARLLLRWKRFDDAFGVVACHGVGGSFGMLLVGIFADYRSNPAGLVRTNGSHINGLIFGHWASLGDQAIAVIAVIAFTAVVTFVILIVIKAANGLRVPEVEEVGATGLNSLFDQVAYESEPAPANN
ncbi:ammonium transporter [Ferrimicrobium sp.]|uniref:ammonium transporter n=1 Tax=Ferrimicrobium sp. TaxID=2926050 RepID=UPI002611139E|nr:ammonium transporter [Ferrimicrobium sp.]